MPSFSVNTFPTPVFSDPTALPHALVNYGPSTVYLGTDASVSPLSGIPLPVLGSIPWDGGTELYAVTALDVASLFVMNNSNAPLAPQAQAAHVLLTTSNLGIVFSSPIECAAWNTLQVKVSGYPAGNGVVLRIQWFDDSGRQLYPEERWQTMFNLSNQINYLTIPVRGSSFAWAVDSSGTASSAMTITGTTRVLDAQSTVENNSGSEVYALAGASPGALAVNRGVAVITNYSLDLARGIFLAIPSWSDVMSVTIHINAAVTVAGVLEVFDRSSGTDLRYGFIDVPVIGTQTYITKQINIPRARPVNLGGVAPQGGGGPVIRPMDITLTYLGYDSQGQ